MPSKRFASWASTHWTRPPRRRDKNRSCSDQPQNPPPYLLGVTGHNVKHALEQQEEKSCAQTVPHILTQHVENGTESTSPFHSSAGKCGRRESYTWETGHFEPLRLPVPPSRPGCLNG